MKVWVIDNGGQYTHVIWRTVRECGFDPIIIPKNRVKSVPKNVCAFIMSGGPGSAYEGDHGLNFQVLDWVFKGESDAPVLGICLGHQIIGHYLGGKVAKGTSAEYGPKKVFLVKQSKILKDMPKEFDAWVSHFDEVKKLPKGFFRTAESRECKIEAMEHETLPIFGVQFHPEVWHTQNGEFILKAFLALAKK